MLPYFETARIFVGDFFSTFAESKEKPSRGKGKDQIQPSSKERSQRAAAGKKARRSPWKTKKSSLQIPDLMRPTVQSVSSTGEIADRPLLIATA